MQQFIRGRRRVETRPPLAPGSYEELLLLVVCGNAADMKLSMKHHRAMLIRSCFFRKTSDQRRTKEEQQFNLQVHKVVFFGGNWTPSVKK